MAEQLSPYDIVNKELGISKEEWDTYRDALASIESKNLPEDGYTAVGGANEHYDGRYQFGRDALWTVDDYFKKPRRTRTRESRNAFRNNKEEQELALAAYTVSNAKTIKRLAKEDTASFDNKQLLSLLGYAHNQGGGGAIDFLKSGKEGKDAFGTKGTKYINTISSAFGIDTSSLLNRTVATPDAPVVTPDSQPVLAEDEMGWQRDIPASSFGGEEADYTGTLEALRDFTTEGMGKDFGNKLVDKTSLGLVLQNAIVATQVTRDVDPSYDPVKEPEVFQEMTKDLDNEQLEELVNDYGNNRHDFILAASAMNAYNQRSKEMQDYAQNHPVLSGVNTVASILGEAGTMLPVSSAISSASLATKITSLQGVPLSAKIGSYITGEIVEQGVQEVIWSRYDKDYEFDPKLFGLGVMAGVGIKSAIHNSEIDKILREVLQNEEGFIRLSKESAKEAIDAVTERAADAKAVALIEKFETVKLQETLRLRQDLFDTVDRLEDSLAFNKEELRAATKGTDDYKQLKSQRQKLQRKLKSFKKAMPEELKLLAEGTHPKLDAKLNPKLTIKEVAKGLGIDKEVIKDPQKLRQFLGLDAPDIADDYILQGEKRYMNVANQQLNEMKNNKRLNANETIKYLAEKLGDNKVGNALYDIASTDGFVSRVLFNKGNLVSSENPLVASFYNWLAPDGMGRTGASKIRAIESQQKYSNIFGGQLMESFHNHGDAFYNEVKGLGKNTGKLVGTINFDDYEKVVVDAFKKRLTMGAEQYRAYVNNDRLADIADEFANSFNKMNADILKRAKEVGVEGVDFTATTDWFHRSWDFRKTRSVNKESLENAVYTAMKNQIDLLDKVVDDNVLRAEAKKFTFGIQNADITNVEGAQKSYIDLLGKLANKTEDVEAQGVIRDEAARLAKNKLKNEQGDLAKRVQLDVNVPIEGTDLKLSDLLEDNFINTQRRYNSRMAARVAAAEHGIKNIDDMEDWIQDAVDAEIKRLADLGVENPKQRVGNVEQSMRQDFLSFKNGNMSGLGESIDDTSSDLLRFVKKYNYAALMQYVGISSIAELSGTVAEAGVATTFNELRKSLIPVLKNKILRSPDTFVDELYNDMRAFTGIGLEDYAFSSKGTNAGNRIFKNGVMSHVEKTVDVLGRTTQGVFGGIETLGRKVTNNSLAIQWAEHFKGTQKSGSILDAFIKPKGISNRVLENSGLGEFDELGNFKFNSNYEKIKSEFLAKAKFDERGNLTSLNLAEWDTDIAHNFGDVITAQSNHIFVNPDSTTMALWQSSAVGQILNQFRTFTINAATKVAGHSVSNAALGFKRGDYAEMNKFGAKIFWGTVLGTLSVSIRDNIKTLGDGQGLNTGIFDEGAMKAAAIGLSRSSIVGQMPTLIDTIGGTFGADPLFEKSSSIGRSKNFFNLATTPTGQAINNNLKGGVEVLKGDVGKGGMRLLKASPFYRQLGVQQLFNYIEE